MTPPTTPPFKATAEKNTRDVHKRLGKILKQLNGLWLNKQNSPATSNFKNPFDDTYQNLSAAQKSAIDVRMSCAEERLLS